MIIIKAEDTVTIAQFNQLYFTKEFLDDVDSMVEPEFRDTHKLTPLILPEHIYSIEGIKDALKKEYPDLVAAIEAEANRLQAGYITFIN